MYKRRYKQCLKNQIILLFLVLFFGLSVGYALINRTLSITGNSEVKQNTWDIHFENLQIKNGSVTAVKEAVIDDELSVDFSVNLNLPGDFYEFTVDVWNRGSIDAMIDSITKTPDLTTTQAKYLNYIIEYQNKEPIQDKQLVKSNEYVRYKVRIEYKIDITEFDLPTTNETLNLGFTVNYVQSNDTGKVVKDNGVFEITANGSLDDIGTIVTIGTEKFYTIGIEGNNVKLLSMYNLYVGYECTSDNSSSCSLYNTEAHGMQDENMKGYVSTQSTRKGTISFSNDSQKGQNYSDYNGSIIEEYVNNYKDLLKSKYNVDVVYARLITKDELISENIGCSESNQTCKGAKDFIYSTSYWSGTSYDTNRVWRVHSDGYFYYYDCLNYIAFGVRPVIAIPKNDIIVEKKIIEFTVDGITYQTEEGMTWVEWEQSSYNINNLNVDLTCTHIEAGNSTIDINSAIKEEDYIIVYSSVCGGGAT